MSNVKLPLQKIYKRRFIEDIDFRKQMWRILCIDFFQRFIPQESVVLEVGSGYCEFINNIQAKKKIAIDINEDARLYANENVEMHICSSMDMSNIHSKSVDVVFVSNFFEHLIRDDIISTLQQVNRILKRGGKLLILQPNYRFCYKDYWMFFDHITPIDDRSLVEILETNGYIVNFVIPRFLPYTTKSALPKSITLVKMYLRFPFIWQFLGSQCFVSVNKQ